MSALWSIGLVMLISPGYVKNIYEDDEEHAVSHTECSYTFKKIKIAPLWTLFMAIDLSHY